LTHTFEGTKAFQLSLPRLPVGNLDHTKKALLKSVRPLLTDDGVHRDKRSIRFLGLPSALCTRVAIETIDCRLNVEGVKEALDTQMNALQQALWSGAARDIPFVSSHPRRVCTDGGGLRDVLRRAGPGPAAQAAADAL
jgi:hypothetical protein